MRKDPRFLAGPTPFDDIADLRRRVALLEANRGGFVASAGAFTKASVQVLTAFGSSTTNYVAAAASGTWETDTTLDVAITPAVTSTLVVIMTMRVFANTVSTGSWNAGLILDNTTTGGRTERMGQDTINSPHSVTVVYRFTGVSAAAHTIEPQICRVDSAHTVTVGERSIIVIAIPE